MAARAQGAVSAVAVRPVDAAPNARDARMDRRRDLPVGPPPSFKINVLQDMRARLQEVQTPQPVNDPGAAPEAEDTAQTAPGDAKPDPAAPYHSGAMSDGAEQSLNIKV